MPATSEAQRRAMFAAAAGHSTLGIPASVGKEFADADKGGRLPAKAKDMAATKWATLKRLFGEWLTEEEHEPEHAADATKQPKASVDFEHPAQGVDHCAECQHFVNPDACALVEGRVQPRDWCRLFAQEGVAQDDAEPKGRAAGVAFVTPAGDCLFLRRSQAGDHAGEWCLPGGGIEDDETAEDAARREAEEEVGGDCFDGTEAGGLVQAHNHVHDSVDFTTFYQPVGDRFDPTLNDEHTEFRWAPPDAPPTPLHPGVRATLDAIMAGLGEDAFEEGKHPRSEGGKFSTTGYHGSSHKDLKVVKADVDERQFDNATSQFGAFFAPDKEGAQKYAGENGKIYEAQLGIEKPYEMPWKEFNYFQEPNRSKEDQDGFRQSIPAEGWGKRADELKDEAKVRRKDLAAKGHDGIVVRRPNGKIYEIASFKDVPLAGDDALTTAPNSGVPAGGNIEEDAAADPSGKLSATTREDVDSTRHREDMPADAFLGPNRTYPVKEKRGGAWAYTRDLLLAAAREARMHGRGDIARRADAVRAREFAGAAEDSETKHDPKTGQFTSSAEMASAVKAPARTQVHETGSAHGGGGFGWSELATHADMHKRISGAGFKRESAKQGTTSHKMGRSAARYSVKEQRSSYSHPEGHTASVKTTFRKYGDEGPRSYVEVHRHPGDSAKDAGLPSGRLKITHQSDPPGGFGWAIGGRVGTGRNTTRMSRGVESGGERLGSATGNDMALDRALAEDRRELDHDGRMHVDSAPLTRSGVFEYLGSEINGVMAGEPGWKPLEPDRRYRLLRPADELEKAAPTFRGLPILWQHKPASAQDHPASITVGAVGNDVTWEDPFLKASLVIWPAYATEAIEDKSKHHLSAGYAYKCALEPGSADGESWDGKMVNIIGNHIAVVENGRSGPTVAIDSKVNIQWAVLEQALSSLSVPFRPRGKPPWLR